jgi:toxin ParE1/3/4
MSRLIRRAGVDDDIFELARYLLDHSEDTARRFVDAVQKTLKDLAQMPRVGSRKEFRDPHLAEVRSWRVQGFANYLIYYLPLEDGIDVLAILHGMRDIESELKRRSI